VRAGSVETVGKGLGLRLVTFETFVPHQLVCGLKRIGLQSSGDLVRRRRRFRSSRGPKGGATSFVENTQLAGPEQALTKDRNPIVGRSG